MEKSDNNRFMDEAVLQFRMNFGMVEVEAMLHSLFDPALGAIGKVFYNATKASGCTETVDVTQRINAAFFSFIYPPNEGENGFQNDIVYGPTAFDRKGKFFGARTHEYVHALQYQHATALHVDPFNEAVDFFISPYDYLLRKERLEQDAYVKGAWLQSLATGINPAYGDALDATPMSVAIFNNLRQKTSSLGEAISEAAVMASESQGRWIDDTVQAARDLWHYRALLEYEMMIKKRLKDVADPLAAQVIVRMEPRDVIEIGTSFGPNPFDGDMTLTLSPANKVALDRLNKSLGITDRMQLPTIQQTLDARGETRADFITRSLQYVGVAPVGSVLAVVQSPAPPPSLPPSSP